MRISQGRRAEIRKHYKRLRLDADKTQQDVESLAGLLVGRYWKIENGIVLPTEDEAKAIARVLRVSPSQLPAVASEAGIVAP